MLYIMYYGHTIVGVSGIILIEGGNSSLSTVKNQQHTLHVYTLTYLLNQET